MFACASTSSYRAKTFYTYALTALVLSVPFTTSMAIREGRVVAKMFTKESRVFDLRPLPS